MVDFQKIIGYLLILILLVGSSGQIVLAFTNPESYFFGMKLGGNPAVVYMILNSAIGVILVYLLLRDLKIGAIISILYFGYNIIECVATSLILYHKLSFPYISVLGLVLSIAVLLFIIIIKKDNNDFST